MDEYGWGLTSRGFRRPTYTELLDALEYKARELWGAKANLSVRSPLGLFLRIFAWILNIVFSVLEDVYNSRFVDTSVGTSLLNLGRAIGLRVLSAQRATGYLMVTGPPGTYIPEGWLAQTAAGIRLRKPKSAMMVRPQCRPGAYRWAPRETSQPVRLQPSPTRALCRG